MTDYSNITHIRFHFDEHPTRKDASYHLNNVFGDNLPDLDALFTAAKDAVHPDAITHIRGQIDGCIQADAVETTDTSRIRPIVDVFP